MENGAPSVTNINVIILGAGPSGLALATLLTRQGLRVAAVDKHRIVVPYPRATHIDDEAVRLLQPLGIAEETAPELTESGDFTLYDGDWQPFMQVKLPQGMHRSQPTEQGWKRDYMFQQPDFESRLRGRLVADERCETWFGWEATSVIPEDDSVRVRVRSRDGLGEADLCGAWLVAADGARSAMRAQIGATTLDLNGTQRSLILDIYPFVRDHLLRDRSSFIYCAPHQNPVTYVRTAVPRCRLEVMLRQRDETARFLDHRLHHEVLSRWFAPGQYRIERADVYQWQSILVQGWRRGRVLLLGDAAHEMAPMLGQGLGSGLRDAANLAWKLARVVQGRSPVALLDTYESERAPHVRHFIEASARVANMAEWWADNPPHAGSDGPVQTIEKIRPSLGPGLLTLGEVPVGTLAPQPRLPDGRLMDDAVGYRFAVLALPEVLAEMDGVHAALNTLDAREVPAVGKAATWLRTYDAVAAIIRPDRYVHALVRSPSQLGPEIRALEGRLASQAVFLRAFEQNTTGQPDIRVGIDSNSLAAAPGPGIATHTVDLCTSSPTKAISFTGPSSMHEDLCQSFGTTLDMVHDEGGPPIT